MKISNTRKINEKITQYYERERLNQAIGLLLSGPISMDEIVFDDYSGLKRYADDFSHNVQYEGKHYSMDEAKKINKNIAECNHLLVKMLCDSYNIGAVYAAWGTNIEKHDYLLDECQALLDLIPTESWFTRGVTKYGHPKHPLYVPYEQKFDWFPIQDYVWNMK